MMRCTSEGGHNGHPRKEEAQPGEKEGKATWLCIAAAWH